MSASAARIAANQANAQKSTGPRTPEGKAAIANNALKHGLRSERNPLDLSNDVVLPNEREEFEATLAAFLEDLAPQGPFETRLVERLAQIDLRLNRAIRMETTHLDMHMGLLTQSMGNALPPEEEHAETRHNWLTTLAFLKNPSATTLLAQYESRLNRDFARTLTQLRAAQKLRVQSNGRISREQTQPQSASSVIAMPTQSPVCEDRGAPAPPPPPANSTQNPANQTQPPSQPSETTYPSSSSPNANHAAS